MPICLHNFEIFTLAGSDAAPDTQTRPIMKKQPRERSDKEAKDSKVGGGTAHGGLYDRHGPIPVPDAHESDTESAWALFEESVMLQDNPRPPAPPALPDQPIFEETKIDETGFEPTDFAGTAFDATRAAPLKP
jgi:hypothetical protein